jgi:hypothetical protein
MVVVVGVTSGAIGTGGTLVFHLTLVSPLHNSNPLWLLSQTTTSSYATASSGSPVPWSKSGSYAKPAAL